MKTFSEMQRLAIIGSGDLGQQMAYHAMQDKHYTIAGFFDDYRSGGEVVDTHPVLGKLSDVKAQYRDGIFDCLMIAIGYKHFSKRRESYNTFAGKIPFGTIVHSSSYVDVSCKIGEGTFILPGCVLDQQVVVKENVLINAGSCIAHDSSIGQHTFLSPRVAVAGFVTIGACCNIGINTTIIDNISISGNVQTGGGTVVIHDIEQAGLYVGNPARFIR